MRIGKVLAVAGAKGVPGAGKERVHRTPAGTEVARRGEAGGQVGGTCLGFFPQCAGYSPSVPLGTRSVSPEAAIYGLLLFFFVQFLGGLSQCEAPSGDKRVRPEIKSSFPVPSPPGTLGSVVLPPKGHGS